MGSMIKIKSTDGFEFGAYQAFPNEADANAPDRNCKGGLIILQEIFGVNDYIRFVADTFAKEGYQTIAPALFDRVEPGIEYTFEQAPLARNTLLQTDQDKALEDIQATIQYLNYPNGVAILGFCWGGLLSFLSGHQFNTVCNIAYYGGRTQEYLDQLPKSPTQFHFGNQDTHISLDQVNQLQDALPEAEYHIYSCGHGFDNHTRASYSEEASLQARKNSIAFLNKHFTNI